MSGRQQGVGLTMRTVEAHITSAYLPDVIFTPCHSFTCALQGAEAACIAHGGVFGAWSTVQLLEGFALLRYAPHPALLGELTTQLLPKLAWLTPEDLASLLHALAALGYLPPGAWLKQFFEHSSSKLPGITPQSAERLVLALAR